MLVSKIKPCMSQYEFPIGETAKGSLNQLQSMQLLFTWIAVAILDLIHAPMPNFADRLHLFAFEPAQA